MDTEEAEAQALGNMLLQWIADIMSLPWTAASLDWNKPFTNPADPVRQDFTQSDATHVENALHKHC
jgi:hypothetical protein